MNVEAVLTAALVLVVVRVIFKRLGRSGPFRVSVWESGGSTSEETFDSFKDAREYADDAASEEDQPKATVFDVRGEVVYRGRHYTSRYPW